MPFTETLPTWTDDAVPGDGTGTPLNKAELDTARLQVLLENTKVARREAAVSADDTTPGPLNGKLVAGTGIELTENNGGGDETLGIAVAPGVFARGHLDGLTLANNATDPTNDIDFKPGQCIDSANTFLMALASTKVKRFDAVWAAGTNVGGRASAVSTSGAKWVHCFVIAKTDGTTDCGFDTSTTAANLLADATGYTKYRRVGSIYWTGSAINLFLQRGDHFSWLTPVQSQAPTAVSTSATNITARVPAVTVIALMGIYVHSTAGHDLFGLITSPLGDNGGTAPSVSTANIHAYAALGVYDQDVHREIRVPTSNSTVVARFNATGSSTYAVYTEGWIDRRGKDA